MAYTAADIRAREFLLRMLLVAPPKWGKTTAAVATCPKPCYVINTDGIAALDYIVLAGLIEDKDMTVEDVSSSADIKKALAHIRAHQTRYKTIIFDNLTFAAQFVEEERRKELKDGRQLYPAIERDLLKLMRDLCALPHHLVVIGHVSPTDAGEAKIAGSFGHILSVAGQAKMKIPSFMQDWVWLQVSQDEQTGKSKYEFLLAPEGHWKQAVRSIKTDAKRMEANVSKFIELASKRARSTSLRNVEKDTVKRIVRK